MESLPPAEAPPGGGTRPQTELAAALGPLRDHPSLLRPLAPGADQDPDQAGPQPWASLPVRTPGGCWLVHTGTLGAGAPPNRAPRPAGSTQHTSPTAAFLAACVDTIGLNLQESTARRPQPGRTAGQEDVGPVLRPVLQPKGRTARALRFWSHHPAVMVPPSTVLAPPKAGQGTRVPNRHGRAEVPPSPQSR